MIILGIDPGIERTGYALVEVDGHKLKALEYGCIKTKAQNSIPERLLELKNDLNRIIQTNKPRAAVVEKLVFVHNASSALVVGQARGVILTVLHENNLFISEYAPSQVKIAVTNNGAADKRSVQEAVRIIFRLKEVPRPDDAADALALAVCHAGQVQ